MTFEDIQYAAYMIYLDRMANSFGIVDNDDSADADWVAAEKQLGTPKLNSNTRTVYGVSGADVQAEIAVTPWVSANAETLMDDWTKPESDNLIEQ